jgi:hypothetical protein
MAWIAARAANGVAWMNALIFVSAVGTMVRAHWAEDRFFYAPRDKSAWNCGIVFEEGTGYTRLYLAYVTAWKHPAYRGYYARYGVGPTPRQSFWNLTFESPSTGGHPDHVTPLGLGARCRRALVTPVLFQMDRQHGEPGVITAEPRLRPEPLVLLRGCSFRVWTIVAATAPGIGWWLFSLVRRRMRRRLAAAGRCAHCGYDLRASPERCPECGAVHHEGGASLPTCAIKGGSN